MTSNRVGTLANRQSCDRCHGQKLRCSQSRQAVSDTGSCIRCLRQGAQCVYSAGLPKGRPSAHSSAGPSAPVSIATTCTLSHYPYPLASKAPPVPSVPGQAVRGPPSAQDYDSHCSANANSAMDIDPTLPWTSTSTHNDSLAGSHRDLLPSIIPAVTTAGQFEPLSDLDWIAATSTAGPSALTVPPPPRPADGHIDPRLPNVDSTEFAIAQLSELSSRLYPLYRSSCALTAAPKDHANQPLVDDAAFESVLTWLVCANAPRRPSTPHPTTSSTLHDTLSASRHLLEILRGLQAVEATPNSASSTASTSTPTWEGANVDFWASFALPAAMGQTQSPSTENILSEQGRASSDYAQPQPGPAANRSGLSSYSDTVVRHLVLACHTLLLNTYSTLLVALQHDTDLQRDCLSAGDADRDVEAEAAALTDMRLVLVVQLSSYFIHRLRQAMDAYLSPRETLLQMPLPFALPLSSSQHDYSNPLKTSVSATTGQGTICDLEMEVQQQLLRLRQTLRI